MKHVPPFLLGVLIASMIMPMWAQTPLSLGPLRVVSYDHGSGFISYVIPCQQPVADLPQAICWIMRAGELHMVDGKLQASNLSIGNLSISAHRVYFRPEQHDAVTIDFATELVKIEHPAGKSYAVLTSGGHSFVIAGLPSCPTCPPNAPAIIPAGLKFDDEYNDIAASLLHFDAILKRITGIAAQAPDEHWSEGLLTVNSDSRVLSSVPPEYPAIAKAARIQGTVVIQAILSKEGTVTNAGVVSGPDLLRDAALTAVKQWKYKPYLHNGAPIAVSTMINVSFTLSSALGGQALQP